MDEKKRTAAAMIFGTLAGVLTVLALMLVYSFITVKVQSVNTALFIPVNIIALCIGAFAGGFLCAKVRKQNGMMYGALCGAEIFIVIFLIMVISGIQPTAQMFLRLAAMLPVSAIAGILGVNSKKKKRKR